MAWSLLSQDRSQRISVTWNRPRKEQHNRMNRTLVLATAFTAGMTAAAATAQTAPAAAPATQPAVQASEAPQAIPAKVALIAFEQAVFSTNEGQQAVQTVQKKYEPRKSQIDALSTEVDTLKKQAQSAPATQSDEERQTRLRNIDTKEKQLNRDAEDATNAYNADLQEAYGKVAQKFSVVMKSYCQQNGFTLLLDVSNQQSSNVMWALQNTDITAAAVESYNRSSGVAAPPPSAPSATRPTTGVTRPSTTPRK